MFFIRTLGILLISLLLFTVLKEAELMTYKLGYSLLGGMAIGIYVLSKVQLFFKKEEDRREEHPMLDVFKLIGFISVIIVMLI